MDIDNWEQTLARLSKILSNIQLTDSGGCALNVDQGFERLLYAVLNLEGTLFLAGNGASAALASHGAVDLMKNGGLKTMTFTDPAMLTAWGNDDGYGRTFSNPLSICMTEKDMLVLISSSGRSPNVLSAAALAKELNAFVVTFSAMEPDNPLRAIGDLNFYLPASTYGQAESGHAVILHHWIDLVAAKSLYVARRAQQPSCQSSGPKKC